MRKESMWLRCTECGKSLMEIRGDISDGALASDAGRAGYVPKLPSVFGHPMWEVFCDKVCKDEWFRKTFSGDVLERGDHY